MGLGMAITFHIDGGKFDRWDELHRLLTNGFAYMAGRIDPPSSLLRIGPRELARKAGDEKLALAMDGDRIVGCVFLRAGTDAVYVGKLAVDSRYRGRGIARTFMGIAEQAAETAGLNWLELQTRVELHENHRIFARLGFARTARSAHAGYARPTSMTMRKRIERSRAIPR